MRGTNRKHCQNKIFKSILIRKKEKPFEKHLKFIFLNFSSLIFIFPLKHFLKFLQSFTRLFLCFSNTNKSLIGYGIRFHHFSLFFLFCLYFRGEFPWRKSWGGSRKREDNLWKWKLFFPKNFGKKTVKRRKRFVNRQKKLPVLIKEGKRFLLKLFSKKAFHVFPNQCGVREILLTFKEMCILVFVSLVSIVSF